MCLKGGAKGPRRVAAPSPRVWGFRSECWSFGLGCLGSLGPEHFAKTLKHVKLAKVGLAKVGQHTSNADCSNPEERYVDKVQDAMVVTGSEFPRP